ncbi:JAB domain-containing protein [Herbaspirillum autotrophicum]|uniref:JAB domain-containing protein n=1 Tax=Herbaspirillum autotrophicum TaxID=180195 RepID=UPI00067B69C3|nr:JAB domain-containing protein [Herbaspirillum autotrophicum]
MATHPISFDTSLLVRDDHGQYVMATADQILDAARHVIDYKVRRGVPLISANMVKEYLKAKLAGYDREVFAVILMDAKLCMIDYVELFQGTVTQTPVYPREVVRLTMKYNATHVIISHNHPTGSTEPSAADEALTQRLKAVLDLVDVRILDHIIVAGNETTSFAERGLL